MIAASRYRNGWIRHTPSIMATLSAFLDHMDGVLLQEEGYFYRHLGRCLPHVALAIEGRCDSSQANAGMAKIKASFELAGCKIRAVTDADARDTDGAVALYCATKLGLIQAVERAEGEGLEPAAINRDPPSMPPCRVTLAYSVTDRVAFIDAALAWSKQKRQEDDEGGSPPMAPGPSPEPPPPQPSRTLHDLQPY